MNPNASLSFPMEFGITWPPLYAVRVTPTPYTTIRILFTAIRIPQLLSYGIRDHLTASFAGRMTPNPTVPTMYTGARISPPCNPAPPNYSQVFPNGIRNHLTASLYSQSASQLHIHQSGFPTTHVVRIRIPLTAIPAVRILQLESI